MKKIIGHIILLPFQLGMVVVVGFLGLCLSIMMVINWALEVTDETESRDNSKGIGHLNL